MSAEATDLSNLHDLALPPEVPWWPPAPGWLVMASIALAAACYYAFRGYAAWKGNAYRRAALRSLGEASDARAIAEILRRSALAISPREQVAGLHGEDWAAWLAERSSVPAPPDLAGLLSRSVYADDPDDSDTRALRDFADRWIRGHRSEC